MIPPGGAVLYVLLAQMIERKKNKKHKTLDPNMQTRQ